MHDAQFFILIVVIATLLLLLLLSWVLPKTSLISNAVARKQGHANKNHVFSQSDQRNEDADQSGRNKNNTAGGAEYDIQAQLQSATSQKGNNFFKLRTIV